MRIPVQPIPVRPRARLRDFSHRPPKARIQARRKHRLSLRKDITEVISSQQVLAVMQRWKLREKHGSRPRATSDATDRSADVSKLDTAKIELSLAANSWRKPQNCLVGQCARRNAVDGSSRKGNRANAGRSNIV